MAESIELINISNGSWPCDSHVNRSVR